MRRLRLLDSAVEEAAQAAAWYERQRAGLGSEFEAAIEAALDLLQDASLPLVPAAGRAGLLGLKRLLLRRFPYQIIVRETPDELTVIAFAHQSRRPGYWQRRNR